MSPAEIRARIVAERSSSRSAYSTVTKVGCFAGYRNRIVHFYDEVSACELHEICNNRVGDIEKVLNAFLRWVEANPDRVDPSV